MSAFWETVMLDHADFVARYDKHNHLAHLEDQQSDLVTKYGDELGRTNFGPTVPTRDNYAKQMANALVGHPVVLYAGPELAADAQAWKLSLNQTAKNLAFVADIADGRDSEIAGWSHPERAGLKVVQLRSRSEETETSQLFEKLNTSLVNTFSPIEVWVEHTDPAIRSDWLKLLGEFVATYLAILNGVDPSS